MFILTPLIPLYLILFVELDANNPALTYTLAVAIIMAIWWVTEIVPLAITSLLPIVLFPALGKWFQGIWIIIMVWTAIGMVKWHASITSHFMYLLFDYHFDRNHL